MIKRRELIALSFVAAALLGVTSPDDAAARDLSVTATAAATSATAALSPAARAILIRGPLPFSKADVDAKVAADRAYRDGVKAGRLRANGRANGVMQAPAVVTQFAGLSDTQATPPDTTGAVGPTRFIETVNEKFAIYDKQTGTTLGQGTLADLWNSGSYYSTTDPQIIWDAKTNRFYYAGLILGSVNELTIGFSKTGSPTSAADFCHYFINFGESVVPDYPKLGDSTNFFIIGANSFDATTQQFLRPDVFAISKPPKGRDCPDPATFKFASDHDLRDSSGNQVFTPVPANEIDDSASGYVITRNGTLPSTKLWLFKVTADSTGNPVFGTARRVVVRSYGVPASAAQPGGVAQVLDTLDARNTQAVVAKNPARGNVLSLWTQHTIAAGITSGIRWYEMDIPTRLVVNSTTLGTAGNFLFNAAISSDRRVDGSVKQFGDRFAITYNETSGVNNINPRISVISGAGAALSAPIVVAESTAPYIDYSCGYSTVVCRWGDYAGASADPRPSGIATGDIWLANQFGYGSGANWQANWVTEIFRIQP